MVSLDESVTARLKKGSKHFEVLVEPDGAFALKKGNDIKIEDILAVEHIFEDASQGERVSELDLESAFGTNNIFEIAELIIKKGELQLTATQRKNILEEKTKRIITFIAQNAINPQTRTPHPVTRIKNAMEESKFRVDPFKSVEDQVTLLMKAIRPLIPIRFEEVEIAVRVPPLHAAKSYGEISKFGKLIKDEWQNDGSWVAIIKIPAGLQTDFYGLINHLTKGESETKLL
ncbi:MAG: ribosome assembly factor SBDS [Methanosarcinaceae archaeon]|jgi:ribosome maturation protein SDO1|nr:ribosome assembly factor SBDS [Methanosarcinaceae archaeon]NKQ38686.1 ribosome assembly factor SBDS [Methanosarcinales archaeon]